MLCTYSMYLGWLSYKTATLTVHVAERNLTDQDRKIQQARSTSSLIKDSRCLNSWSIDWYIICLDHNFQYWREVYAYMYYPGSYCTWHLHFYDWLSFRPRSARWAIVGETDGKIEKENGLASIEHGITGNSEFDNHFEMWRKSHNFRLATVSKKI